jgi:Yip1-like protein
MSTNQVLPPPPQGEWRSENPGPPPYIPPPPMAKAEFSLQDLLRRWQTLLLNPSVAAFDAQRASANWPTIWYSLLGLGVVQAVGALFQRAEALYWNALATSPQFTQYMRDMGIHNLNQMNPSVGAISAFVNAFLGFFVMAGLVYLVARMLGGVGTFLEHTYLLVLAYVPLQMIASVAGLIPVLGGLVAAAAIIYMIVLVVMAISAAHRLTIGSSIVAAVLPALVAGMLIVLLAVVVAILVAGTVLIFSTGGMMH